MNLNPDERPNLEEIDNLNHLLSSERGMRLALLVRAFLSEATVICAPHADRATAASLLATSLNERPLSIFALFKGNEKLLDDAERCFALQREFEREKRDREIAAVRDLNLRKETGI